MPAMPKIVPVEIGPHGSLSRSERDANLIERRIFSSTFRMNVVHLHMSDRIDFVQRYGHLAP